MIATDLAGRGLDVDNIRSVINYDSPSNFEAYVHRSGRTGRAGKTGSCLTFASTQDEAIFTQLKKYLMENGVALPDFLAQHGKTSGNNLLSKSKNVILTA